MDAAPLLNVDTGLQLYYAYGVGSNIVEEATGVLARLTTPVEADYSTTNTSTGIVDVCVDSDVSNPENAMDAALASSVLGVYPNSAATGEPITTRLPIAPAADDILVAYNAQGQEVYRQVAQGPVMPVATADLHPGLYHIVLWSGKE